MQDPTEISPLSWPQADEVLSVEFRQPGDMPGYHWHRQVEVNIPFGGPVRYLINDQLIQLPEGHIGLFWGVIPHRLIECENCTQMGVINIPLSRFLGLPVDDLLLNKVLHGSVVISTTKDLFGSHELRRWHNDSLCHSHGLYQLMQEEITLMIKRVAVSGWKELLHTSPGKLHSLQMNERKIRYIQQMLGFIAEHYHEAIRVNEVAAEVQLHPNYAMNLFKQVMGYSIKDHITMMKVNHARALLAETNRSILDISLTTGFSAMSRFYESFHKLVGVTPHQYRLNTRSTAEQSYQPERVTA
ncbi:MAG: transcriptional regulator MelR [Gammaproteobacteria bacterium]|nr:transcriptional regulator MelR [Gammaproteobacteria bacterium]